MPLIAGDTECTTGLSKRIRDNLLASASTGATDNDALKATAYAIATAVVAELQTNTTIVTACPAGAGTGVLT